MNQVPAAWREFVHQVYEDLFLEDPSLVNMHTGRPARRSRPRSTERAIVGRMMVHASPRVVSVFGQHAVVDYEYERVGMGRRAKRRGAVKISPDLIVHNRQDPAGNFLAIEVKPMGHKRLRAWPDGPALEDFKKLHFLTHHLECAEPVGMRSYEWAICAEVDTHGVDSWWIPQEGSKPGCDPENFDCDYRMDPRYPSLAMHERWSPPT